MSDVKPGMNRRARKNRADLLDADNPAFLKCEGIEGMLTSCVAGELPEEMSRVVMAHVSKCEKCRQSMASIRQAMEMLEKAGKSGVGMPSRLSPESNERILRAYRHPLLGWIYTHHTLFAVLVAVAVATIIAVALAAVSLAIRDEAVDVIPIDMALVDDGKGGKMAVPVRPEWESNAAAHRLSIATGAVDRARTRRRIDPAELAPMNRTKSILVVSSGLLIVFAIVLIVRRRIRNEADGKTSEGPPPLG